MPTLVDGEKCVWCVARACAQVCAVDALYTDGTRTYVNPDDCTQDNACIPECPTGAIRWEDSWTHPEEERVRGLIRLRPERFESLARSARSSPLPPEEHVRIRESLLGELSRAATLFHDEALMSELERFLPQRPGDAPAEPTRAFSAKLRELLEKWFPERALDMAERIRSLRTG